MKSNSTKLLKAVIAVLLSVFVLVTFTSCGHNSFENIMGYSGYYKDETLESDFKIRTYYGKTTGGNELVIAESFGYSINAYVIDIDGDGITELLSNSMFGGDSHEELYVFKRAGENIQIGYVNWQKLNIQNIYYWGVNAVQTQYISDENCIQITYCSTDPDDTVKTIKTGFEVIDYKDWDGINYPSVEVEY